jgi:iron-sulfur cluster assembly protein
VQLVKLKAAGKTWQRDRFKIGRKKVRLLWLCVRAGLPDTLNENDAVFEDFGVKVIVPESDLEFVDGIELDYRREGINEAFQFNNPNVKGMRVWGELFCRISNTAIGVGALPGDLNRRT